VTSAPSDTGNAATASAPVPPAAAARLPRHIAIVMDGNGRWAERRHRPRSFGHRAGVKAVRASVEFCLRQRVPALTLFAFSSENWQRPAAEVGALMGLFIKALDREVAELHKHGVRLRFIGDRPSLPEEIRKRMDAAESRTAGNTALALNIAASYGGRWDIAQACRRLAVAVRDGALDADTIDAGMVARELCLADQPEPDLFIRTGGDQRISNFLVWQLAYAELWFTDVLWPDFGAGELELAVRDFGARERRFGKTSDQVRAEHGGHV
jgi:undecaprenyl diphosphate synthase